MFEEIEIKGVVNSSELQAIDMSGDQITVVLLNVSPVPLHVKKTILFDEKSSKIGKKILMSLIDEEEVQFEEILVDDGKSYGFIFKDGKNINIELIKQGGGFYNNDDIISCQDYTDELQEAEDHAKNNHLGVWKFLEKENVCNK